MRAVCSFRTCRYFAANHRPRSQPAWQRIT